MRRRGCVIEGHLVRLEGLRVWGSGCGNRGFRRDDDGKQCVGLAKAANFSILQLGGQVHACGGRVPSFQLRLRCHQQPMRLLSLHLPIGP